MNRILTAALAAVALFAAAVSASAETLDVTWIVTFMGQTQPFATWKQDSDPTPIAFATGEGTVVPISDFVAYAPVGSLTSITYYSSGFGVGTFSTLPFGGLFVTGPQAYTGAEATPHFAPGSFSGLLQGSYPSTLVFAIPETSTWAMMLAGFAGLGALSFRVRRRALIG